MNCVAMDKYINKPQEKILHMYVASVIVHLKILILQMMPIESKIVLETGFQHAIASYIYLAIHSDYVVMDKYLKPQEKI